MSELLERIRTPRDGELRPSRLVEVPAIDTGGAWRPAHRPQDPAKDPAEPGGGESSSAGTDHGWSNCTMSAGAVAYAYEAHAAGVDEAPWGGDLRHSGQPDMTGGTDLGDLESAWAELGGYNLTNRSGAGWGAVVEAHEELRAVVVQGEGDCPGSGDFTGSHACCIGVETDSEGRWLWSDPVTSGWQWASPSAIRSWAERLSSGILFATSSPMEGDMGDVVVTDPTPMLLELELGDEVLNLDGSLRTSIKAERVGTFTSPFGGVTPGGTATRAIVWTNSSAGTDLLLACYRNDAVNLRPIDGGGGEDPDAIKAERDEEWREWILAGSPGEPE